MAQNCSRRQRFLFILLLSGLIVLCAAISQTPRASALGSFPAVDPNMVLYYHFNNNSAIGENDSFVVDSTNLSNNGSVFGAVFHPSGGYLGDGAFQFNGSQFINSSDRDAFSTAATAGNVTWSLWINPANVTAQTSWIFGKGNSNDFEFGLQLLTTRRLEMTVWQKNGTAHADAFTPTNFIFENTWYHVVVTYQRNVAFSIYVNGVLTTTNTTFVGTATNGNSSLLIGDRRSSDVGFNGTIDEFIIFNKTLNSSDVRTLYTTYVPCLTPTNLLSVTGDALLCQGTYYLNGSGSNTGNGALIINGHNLVLDGNGSTIVGNFSSPGISASNAFQNVTIKNFKIVNFARGLFLQHSTSFVITNVTVTNSTQYGILMRDTNRSLIDNSTIIGNGISLTADGISYDTAGNLNEIARNNITGTADAVYITGGTLNTTIQNDWIFNTTNTNMGIAIDSGANSSLVYNNTILYAGWNCIDIESFYNNISFNGCSNSNHHALDLVPGTQNARPTSGYNQIYNNTFFNTQYTAIYLQVTIFNAVFNNIVDTVINKTFDKSGIAVEGNASANYANNISQNTVRNVANALYCGAADARFSGNDLHNISSHDVEITSIATDLVNAANCSIEENVYSGVAPEIRITGPRQYSTIYSNSSYSAFVLNGSFSGGGATLLHLNNLSQSLVYFSNGSVACQNLCQFQVNISIQSLNWSYLLPHFNLTEGTTRQFSPIWFSRATATLKTIASNLTQSINVTGVVFTNGTVPESPRFVSHSGNFTQTFSASQYVFDASAQRLMLNISNLEPANGSNNLSLDSMAPRLTVNSPTPGAFYSFYDIPFNVSVNESNADTMFYAVLNRDGNTTFSNSTNYNAPAGSYDVVFCANDTSGNTNCTAPISFTVENPSLSGGSQSVGGGTVADVTVISDSNATNGTAIRLANFTIQTDKTWTIGTREYVYVNTFDSSGFPVDVDSIAIGLNIPGNAKADDTLRIDKGKYQRSFTIERTDATVANITVLVAQGSKEIGQARTVEIQSAPQLLAITGGVINTGTNVVKRLLIIIEDNLWLFFGLLGLVVVMLLTMVIVNRRSTSF